ncbi:MAG TPA: anthranilate phosphoribosyltransferase [Candidatus Didemnitutus sp.]|nr:anthranilate phosphoribosyltransferase [Candidatus Didemnitutus sp.]
MLEPLTKKLVAGQDLAPPEVANAAALLASAEMPDEPKVAFLAALAAKGETPVEIAAFATAYRAQAFNPGVEEWAGKALDIVGTGGDHAGGFNISSLVVLVLASAGVPVMKHGNRGVTSKCGSADLLSALGVDLTAPPEKSQAAMRELGYCFFFAPAYHPSFRNIAPARKALAARGQRTIFNLLGPLINPGRPAYALIGVSAPPLVDKLASALEELGCDAGLVAHGIIAEGRGIDEMTTATVNHVQGLGRLRSFRARWQPGELGLPPAPFEDLVGGDVAANVATTQAILAGRGPQGLVDTIVLNAAAGLWITGRTADIRSGLAIAHDLLVGGAVAKKIAATREFYRR